MKAVVYTRYGPPEVLRLKDVKAPVPADDEMLVRVHAVSLNRSDWELLVGKPFYARLSGLLRPGNPILGSDVAGVVAAVGKGHAQFKPGDAVFGEMENYSGGFAEYACTRGDTWALKPAGLTFEQAAAIPQAGVIALQGLRGKVQAGQSVLINGGGGGCGAFAVQIARHYQAEVTAVDHTAKLDFMRALGAEQVIDYTREDFTRSGRSYDLVLDFIASRPVSALAPALKPGGSYYAVGGSVSTLLQILLLGSRFRSKMGKNLHILAVRRTRQDLEAITGLCEAGAITLPIDKSYPLTEVPEALRYLGEGRARGKVVITVAPGSDS